MGAHLKSAKNYGDRPISQQESDAFRASPNGKERIALHKTLQNADANDPKVIAAVENELVRANVWKDHFVVIQLGSFGS